MRWWYDPATGELFYPDGTVATTLDAETATMPTDAQLWAVGLVQEIGMANVTDEQMMWLLSITAGLVGIGRPPSDDTEAKSDA